MKLRKTEDEDCPVGGRIQVLQRLTSFLCSPFPEGGAKLLEEDAEEAKLKGPVRGHTEARGPAAELAVPLPHGLGKPRFQKRSTCAALFMLPFSSKRQPHMNSATGFPAELNRLYRLN